MIDSTARIDPSAVLGPDVEVGAWSSIGAGVEIGAGTRVGSNVVITGPTTIGVNNRIYPFCAIGGDPQDKKYEGTGESRLEIGDDNTIREYCSINRGTPGGHGVTRVGNDNWIMAYCHVAHDCTVGSHTIFANNATLAGHVEIHDFVILGGFTGVHQFCRLGESSFSAISAVIVRDVPPYVMVDGNTARPRSINREGLRRRGMSPDCIAALKQCYRVLYRQGHTLDEALKIIGDGPCEFPEVTQMMEFIRGSARGIVR